VVIIYKQTHAHHAAQIMISQSKWDWAGGPENNKNHYTLSRTLPRRPPYDANSYVTEWDFFLNRLLISGLLNDVLSTSQAVRAELYGKMTMNGEQVESEGCCRTLFGGTSRCSPGVTEENVNTASTTAEIRTARTDTDAQSHSAYLPGAVSHAGTTLPAETPKLCKLLGEF
jgi:hypothetical protein